MPRTLTEQDKQKQRRRLLDRGGAIVLARGVKKVSVAEIAQAAGMAKGAFYLHFESKELYLVELVWALHQRLLSQAQQLILEMTDFDAGVRILLDRLFASPEATFFMRNAEDIDEIITVMHNHESELFLCMEVAEYAKLLVLAGLDTSRVRPGVVHNWVHAIFLMKTSTLMVPGDVAETYQQMVASLVEYLRGGLT